MYKIIAIVATVLALGLVNLSIYEKEQVIAKGQQVYMKLAPVDPRSLMQGDYMRLRFAASSQIPRPAKPDGRGAKWPSVQGHIVVRLDEHSVGHYSRVAGPDEVVQENEVLMQYRIRGHRVKFATNAFFFQEGLAELYEQAEYGEFRVAEDGELLLVDLVKVPGQPLK